MKLGCPPQARLVEHRLDAYRHEVRDVKQIGGQVADLAVAGSGRDGVVVEARSVAVNRTFVGRGGGDEMATLAVGVAAVLGLLVVMAFVGGGGEAKAAVGPDPDPRAGGSRLCWTRIAS